MNHAVQNSGPHRLETTIKEPTMPDVERHGRLLAIAGAVFYTEASVSHTVHQ